ncbi:MAG: hypothetical protein ABI091_19260, partial [Ferruginibacter sp.]
MGIINSKEKELFNKEGFILLRNLFSKEEIRQLSVKAHNDVQLDKVSTSVDDGKGNKVRLSLWNHPG